MKNKFLLTLFTLVVLGGCSSIQEEEAEKIQQLIKLLLLSKYKLGSEKERSISLEDILIIAPFNVQVNYLKRKLDKKLKLVQ